MKTVVIGDIHGGFKALEQVLEKANLPKNSKYIFVGDYVDGWSESAEVVSYLIDFSEKNDCIFIRGNHDELLYNYLKFNDDNPAWRSQGGESSIKSYVKLSEEEKEKLYKTIGLGALKYYILKVDPKKRILFNPEESVDFQGNTGPFIQYTYARIQSILRKAKTDVRLSAVETPFEIDSFLLNPKEKELLKIIQQFPETIQLAAENYSPALIANYTYELVKEFNGFYQNVPILATDNDTEKAFRVKLSAAVAEVIKSAFKLLGIEVPERM